MRDSVLLIKSVDCEPVSFSMGYVQVAHMDDEIYPYRDLDPCRRSNTDVETIRIQRLTRVDRNGEETTIYYALTNKAKESLSVVLEAYEVGRRNAESEALYQKARKDVYIKAIDSFNSLSFIKKVLFVLKGRRV